MPENLQSFEAFKECELKSNCSYTVVIVTNDSKVKKTLDYNITGKYIFEEYLLKVFLYTKQSFGIVDKEFFESYLELFVC